MNRLDIISNAVDACQISFQERGKLNRENIIAAMLSYEKNDDKFWKALGYGSMKTLSNTIPKVFKEKPRGMHLYNYILLCYNYRRCKNCKEILTTDAFSGTNQSVAKLSFICKTCKYERNKEWSLNNVDKVRAASRTQKAKIRSRVVDFDMPNHKSMEHQREDGKEYDHVIPTNGKTVSGLHVASNLLQIPKLRNKQKSNKFNQDLYARVLNGEITMEDYTILVAKEVR